MAIKTLEAFKDARRGNYCTLPTIDVEILPDIHHCNTCGFLVMYEPHPRGGLGSWAHTDKTVPGHGYIAPKTRCRYCHSEDDATYHQHAWHDAVECERCGGIDGYAVGD